MIFGMTRRLARALACGFLLASGAAAADAAPDGAPVPAPVPVPVPVPAPVPVPGPAALWRVTFVVGDAGAALAVWRDILGFSLAYEGGSPLGDARLGALFGLEAAARARLFVLVSGNVATGNIGFLVPEGGGVAPAAPGTGMAALFVKTTAMDEVVPRLVAAGCTLLSPPGAPSPGRNRMAWLVDPNGVRFVLTEREAIELAYPPR